MRSPRVDVSDEHLSILGYMRLRLQPGPGVPGERRLPDGRRRRNLRGRRDVSVYEARPLGGAAGRSASRALVFAFDPREPLREFLLLLEIHEPLDLDALRLR